MSSRVRFVRTLAHDTRAVVDQELVRNGVAGSIGTAMLSILGVAHERFVSPAHGA